jgi:hypothetical protein
VQELLSLLPTILRRADYQPEVCEQAVFAAWTRAVGEAVSMNAVPFRLYQKRLIVLTSDDIWKAQLRKMSSQIIFKINRLLGASMVSVVEYRVDPVQVAARQPHSPEVRFEHQEALMKELEPLVDQIGDPELRRAFLRAASKCLERHEAEE